MESDVSTAHQTLFEVRDYECDLQGVVNNAVYMNVFLKDRGDDFAEVTRQGIHLVIVRAELDYRSSLTSGDAFAVLTRFRQQSRLKYVFDQEIVRAGDSGAIILSATMTATALNEKGRPFEPTEILARLVS